MNERRVAQVATVIMACLFLGFCVRVRQVGSEVDKHLQFGVSLAQSGQYEEAASELTQAIEIASSEPLYPRHYLGGIYFSRGNAFHQMHNWEGAENDLGESNALGFIQSEDEIGMYLDRMAICKYMQGDFSAAIADYKRLRRLRGANLEKINKIISFVEVARVRQSLPTDAELEELKAL